MNWSIDWNNEEINKYYAEQKSPRRRMERDIYNLMTRGIVWAEERDVITGYYQREVYDWDTYFENLFLSYLGVYKYCRSAVEAFLDRQEESGFVPRTIQEPRWRQHFKPFLAQTALLGSRQSGNFHWLQGKYYLRLKKYLEYWTWHCDADKNGLSFWDSADHSGMDNQSLRCGHIGVMEYEGVDLNCYLIREFRAMKELAEELGYPEDSQHFEEKAEETARAINEYLWDEEDGFYYDRSEKTGKLSKYKSIVGFLPLWVGIVSNDRAERLIREHLLNPEEFWLKYPVATWARNEEGYIQGKTVPLANWMGPTWMPTNYMIFHGLLQYGYRDEARVIAEKSYELLMEETDTREYYNSENGCGLGRCPFWGWSTLGYVMKYEYETGCSASDLKCRSFRTLGQLNMRGE